MHPIRLGTCGWSYKEWSGVFYPEDLPQREFLPAYAERHAAVEIRNKTWMTERFAACLRAHHAIWALADQAWVPSPLSLVQKLDAVTGPLAYVRLLGDRAEVDALTQTLDHIVIDRPEQIQAD